MTEFPARRSKRRRDFYKAALASKAPRTNYATARKMLDDLPAIVMYNYGEVGARTVNNLVTLHKNDVRWRRTDCKWLTTRAVYAANELQRDPDLPPDLKSRCEAMWVFDALRSARAWKTRQYVPEAAK